MKSVGADINANRCCGIVYSLALVRLDFRELRCQLVRHDRRLDDVEICDPAVGCWQADRDRCCCREFEGRVCQRRLDASAPKRIWLKFINAQVRLFSAPRRWHLVNRRPIVVCCRRRQKSPVFQRLDRTPAMAVVVRPVRGAVFSTSDAGVAHDGEWADRVSWWLALRRARAVITAISSSYGVVF